MKQILTLLLLLCSMTAAAQDVIVKNNKQIIKCRIVEVTDEEITYKKWEDPNGSNYVMNRKDILTFTRDETLVRTAEPMPSSMVDLFSTQYDDEHLKMLDAQLHPFAAVQFNPYEIRLKRLKWTAIGTAAAAPMLFLWAGFTDYSLNQSLFWTLFTTSVASAATSITTGVWYGVAKNKAKRNIYSASIYEQGHTFKNGTRFSASTDLLRDNRTNQTAIGLGFHYNF